MLSLYYYLVYDIEYYYYY